VIKKKEFLGHVDAKLTNDKPADGTEEERVANFLKSKTAEKVIKAVVSHKIEDGDYKQTVINEIKKQEKDSNGQLLNLKDYGTNPGTIEKPNDEFIVQFDYEEITGKKHSYKNKTKSGDDGDKTEGTF